MTANWGHLLDDEEVFCSPECDVIIHKKDGQVRRWNGSENPVMDFRFIRTSKAVAVISCKSQTKTVDVDYVQQVKHYVGRVWLFGECCGPRSGRRLLQRAQEAGYEHFWYLYSWSPCTEVVLNEDGWQHFVGEVEKLKELV